MLPPHASSREGGGRAVPHTLHVLAVDRAAHGPDAGAGRLGHGRCPVLIMRPPMRDVRRRRLGRRGVPVPVVRTRVGHMAVSRGLAGRRRVVAAVPGVTPTRPTPGRNRHLGWVVRLVTAVGVVVVRVVVGRVVRVVVRLGTRIARGLGSAALVVVVVRRPRTAAVAAVGVGEAAASDSVSLRSHDHQQLSGP